MPHPTKNPALQGGALETVLTDNSKATPATPRNQSAKRPNPAGLVDFASINAAALAALPVILMRWFPAGRLEGREFCIGSLRGESGRSLKINMTSGVWRDFAGDVGGSDPISLAAALAGISQAEAARNLAVMLGLGGRS